MPSETRPGDAARTHVPRGARHPTGRHVRCLAVSGPDRPGKRNAGERRIILSPELDEENKSDGIKIKLP
jgi:hypothetical protein